MAKCASGRIKIAVIALQILAVLSVLLCGKASIAQNDVNFGGVGMPHDPGIPDSKACDKDYWNVLKAKSWLMGQYDTLVNQTLIVKPDSVFEYTCFHQFLGYTSEVIAPIFSESQEFKDIYIDIGTTRGPRIIHTGFAQPIGSMAESLSKSILEPLVIYLENNFYHTLLGGTSSIDAPEPVMGGANYTCSVMAQVWHVAKCTNALPPWLPNTGIDENFYEIEDFVGFDPREYPRSCDNSQVFQKTIDLSNNEGPEKSTVDKPVPGTSGSYAKLKEHPSKCVTEPIPVGLDYTTEVPVISGEKVIGRESRNYSEHVCPNQGCHYDPVAHKCVE
jgi:hypothetical protein